MEDGIEIGTGALKGVVLVRCITFSGIIGWFTVEAFRPPRPKESDSGTIDDAAEDSLPSGFATANQIIQQQTRKDSRPDNKVAEDSIFHNEDFFNYTAKIMIISLPAITIVLSIFATFLHILKTL